MHLGELRAEPFQHAFRKLRPLVDQIDHLSDDDRAGIPEEEPHRHEDRRKHDDEGNRRIAQHAPPPLVVWPEEQGEEKAEDDRHQRGRCKCKRLDDHPGD